MIGWRLRNGAVHPEPVLTSATFRFQIVSLALRIIRQVTWSGQAVAFAQDGPTCVIRPNGNGRNSATPALPELRPDHSWSIPEKGLQVGLGVGPDRHGAAIASPALLVQLRRIDPNQPNARLPIAHRIAIGSDRSIQLDLRRGLRTEQALDPLRGRARFRTLLIRGLPRPLDRPIFGWRPRPIQRVKTLPSGVR